MVESTAFGPNRVARGVAIKTAHKNLGAAGTRFRPVRVAIMGVGDASASYATTKRQVFSAAEAGAIYGYTNPLYLTLLSVLPPNGDGVGDIPVTLYPLAQPAAGVQAAGTITPTGTQTKQQTYNVLVNNVKSGSIVMAIGDTAGDFTDKATTAINAILGMPGTSTHDSTAGTVLDTTSYPVADQDGLTSIITIDGGTAQTVTFSGATTTASAVQTQMSAQLTGCVVTVDGGQVLITSNRKGTASTVAAAAGTGGLTWAAPAAGTNGALTFTMGWKGTDSNDGYLEITGPDDAESTFVIVQPTAGAGTHTASNINAALAQIGSVWETHLISSLLYTDSTVLDTFASFNEGRWGATVRKPLKVYTGTSEATLATVTAVTDARKTDRTNIILTNAGSNDLSCVVAADQVRRIAPLANVNPPHDYGSQKSPRLTPGTDAVQWTGTQRQAAVIAGTSTIEVKDGVVNISDVVTCYHPTGEEPPAYRHDVDLEKIATMIYGADLIFNTPNWDGAPLVPNNQATKNKTTKKPKMGLSALGKLFEDAADDAIISDPDFAKENTTADIDGTNPKRFNVNMVFKLSGNANVISIDMNFGFYYGE